MAWVQMWQIAIICYAHIIIQNKKGTNMKRQKAFTLAELLVAILIIAVLLTLLAPVISKRRKDTISINMSNYKSQLFLFDKNNPLCQEIPSTTNKIKCLFTAPSGVSELGAIAVSGGGGGAGATQPSIEYGKKLTVANATPKTSKTQELTITNGMKNIIVSELIGSGAGGGGASWMSESSGPQSQADCDPYNAMFIPAKYNGTGGKNTCVTKYNVGDPGGPPIVSTAVKLTVGQLCASPNSGLNNCCWSGKTADNCDSSDEYSGCNRTVCLYTAGARSCSNWTPGGMKAGSWRVPTKEEALGWAANYSYISKNKGSNGLQFCDEGSSCDAKTTAPNCKTSSTNTKNHWCFPQCVATSNFTGGRNVFYLEGGEARVAILGSLAVSYRCVFDGSIGGVQKFSALSGGGGGAGAYIKNYQIPNDVISSNIGGKIKLFSAAGGSGGSSASSSGSSGSNGTNGLASYVEVYAPDGVTLVWGIRASGGNYGYRATSTAAGNGGAQTSANSCQLYENGVWKSINCTGVGIKGTNGNKVESASSTNTATGGSGGGSMYNSSTVIGGGSGGSISSANGYNGSVYGAGGGGATIVFDSSNNVTKGIGGNGANGVAEITYDLVRQAAGGGGGGGGAFAKVEKIKVNAGQTYEIFVGGGGVAGNISSNGSDGGESGFAFDSLTYTLSGGKGGQKGISATDTTSVIQGIGGSGGIVSSNVTDTTNIEYKNGSKGDDANTFTKNDTHANSLPYGGSYGGIGGTSGIDTKGGCGGLFIDVSICSNTMVNGIYPQFVAPYSSSSSINYGQAGAGGGGGGWSENVINYPNPGAGSQGQDGYVLLYWRGY